MTEAEIRVCLDVLVDESRKLHDRLDALVRERIFRETGFKPGDRVLTWSFKAGDGPMYVIGVRYVVADAWACDEDAPPCLSFNKPPGADFAPYARVEDVARTVEELNDILAGRFPGKNVRVAYVVEGSGGGEP